MCLKPGGAHEPYADAIICFENGYALIKAYKEKYGFSYRKAIRHALKTMDKAQKRKEQKYAVRNDVE